MKSVEYAWGIWNPRMGFYYGAFSDTRQCAITDHVQTFGKLERRRLWSKCKRAGDRAVKVKIERYNWKRR